MITTEPAQLCRPVHGGYPTPTPPGPLQPRAVTLHLTVFSNENRPRLSGHIRPHRDRLQRSQDRRKVQLDAGWIARLTTLVVGPKPVDGVGPKQPAEDNLTEVEASNLEIAALTGYRSLRDDTPDDVRMIVLGVIDRLSRELIEARTLTTAAVPA